MKSLLSVHINYKLVSALALLLLSEQTLIDEALAQTDVMLLNFSLTDLVLYFGFIITISSVDLFSVAYQQHEKAGRTN